MREPTVVKLRSRIGHWLPIIDKASVDKKERTIDSDDKRENAAFYTTHLQYH